MQFMRVKLTPKEDHAALVRRKFTVGNHQTNLSCVSTKDRFIKEKSMVSALKHMNSDTALI